MKYKKTAIVILVLLTILFVILILLGRFYYEKAGEYLELAQAAPLYSEARDSNYDYMFALQEKSSGFRILSSVIMFFMGVVLYVMNVHEGGWLYYLSNGYKIRHKNTKEIVLEKGLKSEIEKVVDDYIVAFCHNDHYVCLQIGLPPAKGKKSRTEEFQNISQYYIVDMEQNAKFGPFTEGQFVWESRTSDVGELSDWIPTDLKPHHAVVL